MPFFRSPSIPPPPTPAPLPLWTPRFIFAPCCCPNFAGDNLLLHRHPLGTTMIDNDNNNNDRGQSGRSTPGGGGDDDTSSSASVVGRYCWELVTSVRRLSSHGSGARLSPEGARLLSRKLVS